MKQIFSTLLMCFVCLIAFCSFAQKKYTIKKVVIDPGHGGHDGGCKGSSALEKKVALAISLKLGKYIEDNLKDVKVIYTRKRDVFLELHERAEIANNNKADLFICIHCNSGPKQAYGTETYVLGLHKSDDNLRVAQRENASILMEENYQSKYEGFDTKSPEAYIVFSLYQNAFLEQSLNFASKIEEQFKNQEGRLDRGVKQAGFLVLWRTTMPGVLIETGFLSNQEEEKYMNSENGQNQIALSIFRAFQQYKSEIETGSAKSVLPVTDKIEKQEEEKQQNNNTTPKKDEPVSVKLPEEKPSPVPPDKNDTKVQENNPEDTITDAPKKEEKEKIIKKEKEYKVTEIKPDTAVSLAASVIFRVQIAMTDGKKPLATDSPVFKGLSDIKTEKTPEGMMKYTTGNFTGFQEAVSYQGQMREKGFKDAFVVVYKDGKRISLQEAARLGIIRKKP